MATSPWLQQPQRTTGCSLNAVFTPRTLAVSDLEPSSPSLPPPSPAAGAPTSYCSATLYPLLSIKAVFSDQSVAPLALAMHATGGVCAVTAYLPLSKMYKVGRGGCTEHDVS